MKKIIIYTATTCGYCKTIKEELKTRLISKVKPEVLKALKDEAKIKYSSSYEAIVLSLSDVEKII